MPPNTSNVRGYQEQLDQVLKLGLSAPQTIPINLSVAVTDKEYLLAGNSFYIFDSPDQTSYISVKLNRSDMPALDLVWQTGFRAPFTKLYITTPAGQAGIMKIIIAAEDAPLFEIIDKRSGISAAMNDVLEELRGDLTPKTWGTEKTVGLTAVSMLAANVDRKAAIVQAKSTNTGLIYIGYDNTVTSSKWIAELEPGQAFCVDDYRGPVFAIATVAAQLVGYGEW